MYNSLNINDICKYYDINSYMSAISVNCLDYLNILHVHTCFLNKNYDHLISLLESLPKLPNISCISKTWLKPSTAPLNEIEGFKSYHMHWSEGYGGVALYVNFTIPSSLLSDYCLCDDDIELYTIEVTSLHCFFHDKHQKINKFNSFMDKFLSQTIVS